MDFLATTSLASFHDPFSLCTTVSSATIYSHSLELTTVPILSPLQTLSPSSPGSPLWPQWSPFHQLLLLNLLLVSTLAFLYLTLFSPWSRLPLLSQSWPSSWSCFPLPRRLQLIIGTLLPSLSLQTIVSCLSEVSSIHNLLLH